MRKHLLFLLILIAGMHQTCSAQYTPVYSQYFLNGLLINPAYAGSKDALCINAMNRSQWTGIDGAPNTQILSAHTPLGSNKKAGGIILSHDRITISRTTTFSLAYSYTLLLGKGKLAFGISPGFESNVNNWFLLNSTEPDQTLSVADVSTKRIIAGTGIYYHTKRWFAGFSSPEILSAGSNRNFKPYFLTGGLIAELNYDVKIKPSFLLKQQGHQKQVDLNTTIYYRNIIGAGISFRNGESFTGLIQYTAARNLKLAYSYDHPIGIVRGAGASHEIMLEYLFSFRKEAVNPRYF